jgi:hypothetical protein
LFDIRGDVYRCTATGEIRTSQGKVARAEDHDALSGDVVESDVVSSHDDRAAHTLTFRTTLPSPETVRAAASVAFCSLPLV